MTRLEAIRAIAVTVAVASLLLFVFRYAVEASSITIRGAWVQPFFYHGDWLGRVMSCGTWLLTALLIYVSAPVANRLPGVRDGGSVQSFIFSIAGSVLTILPPLYFIAQSAIYAIKITIVGSWASEGRIFTEFDAYPHNMLLILLPWSLSGLCLTLLSRRPSSL